MRVPDEIRDCVCFVCCITPSGDLFLGGTAFFVIYPADESEPDVGFLYIVTCHHVIEKVRVKSQDGKVYLRMNYVGHGARLVEVVEEWIRHPIDTSVDCAVAAFDKPAGGPQLEHRWLPLNMAATDERIASENIGIGDHLFYTGLFVNHSGKKRNIPIVRVGNIAAMPEERVTCSTYGSIEAILVESRSIGGLSGSPVFVQLSGLTRLGRLNLGGPSFALLGMMRGHWEGNLTETDASDDAMQLDADDEEVNVGIAVVVPAQKIVETLEHPYFAEPRERALKDRERKNEAVLDAADDVARSVPGPKPETPKIHDASEDAVEKAIKKE